MIYLVGETSNGWARLADTQPRGIGRCYVERPIRPAASEPFFLDNGVFRTWNQAGRVDGLDYSADYERFERKLTEVAELEADPLFVVAPDRPGDAASILTSLEWIDEWMFNGRQAELDPIGWWTGSRSMPVALAVQDGMTPESLEELGRHPETDYPWLESVDVIFVGGSDAFKAPERIAEWRAFCDRHGLRLHFARCTQSRIEGAIAAGCDSADSSHPNRLGPDRWARFLEVYDGLLGAEFDGGAGAPDDLNPSATIQEDKYNEEVSRLSGGRGPFGEALPDVQRATAAPREPVESVGGVDDRDRDLVGRRPGARMVNLEMGTWLGLSMAEYNAVPAIRGSELNAFRFGGGAYLDHRREHGINDTAAMMRGRALHSMMEHQFDRDWVTAPEGMSRRVKAWKVLEEEATSLGLEAITHDDAVLCSTAADALMAHPYVAGLKGTHEPSLFLDGCKLRPDYFGHDADGRMVSINWKSTTLAGLERVPYSFERAYGLSAGLYQSVLEAVYGPEVVQVFPFVAIDEYPMVHVYELLPGTSFRLKLEAEEIVAAIKAHEKGVGAEAPRVRGV